MRNMALVRATGRDAMDSLPSWARWIIVAAVGLSPILTFFTAGVICRGPLAIRPTDLLGIAFAYGQFSSDLNDAQEREHLTDPTILPQTYESVVECSYRLRFYKNSFFVQPNVQYIINPGATGIYNNAVVLGCQIGFNF